MFPKLPSAVTMTDPESMDDSQDWSLRSLEAPPVNGLRED